MVNLSIAEIIYMLSLIVLGILASISDFKKGIIKNTLLAVFGIYSIFLGILYYGIFARDLFFSALVNVLLVIMLSFILFYSHALAGGDCKLCIVMSLLYPAGFYFNYNGYPFTLPFSLGIAIILGYLYFLIFSIFRIANGKTKVSTTYIRNSLLAFLKSFISASVYIAALNLLAYAAASKGLVIIQHIRIIIYIGIAWAVGKYSSVRKWYIVISVLLIDLICGYVVGRFPFSLDIGSYAIVTLLLLCRITIGANIYEEKPVSDIKPGMILSTFSSAMMQGSKIKGLPGISTEDLKSRLNSDEAAAVIRWAKTRKVGSLILIKKIPFAFFITLGFLGYFLIWGLTK